MTKNLVHKALKLRIYPSPEQEILINKTFGCCRQIYNTYLQEKIEFYIENILPVKETATKQEINEIYKKFKRTSDKEYGELFPYMKETSSTARHEAARNLDAAYNNFFSSNQKTTIFRKRIWISKTKNKERFTSKLSRSSK